MPKLEFVLCLKHHILLSNMCSHITFRENWQNRPLGDNAIHGKDDIYWTFLLDWVLIYPRHNPEGTRRPPTPMVAGKTHSDTFSFVGKHIIQAESFIYYLEERIFLQVNF